jgi:hypothetical protein
MSAAYYHIALAGVLAAEHDAATARLLVERVLAAHIGTTTSRTAQARLCSVIIDGRPYQ